MSRFPHRSWLLLAGLMLMLIACSGGAPPATPTPTIDPAVQHGMQVFSQHCAACHAVTPDTVLVGPSLAGIATRGGERMPNIDARQYIEISILKPDLYIVPDFPNAMPADLGKKLTGQELDDLVTYLMTLE